jgi:hypothetical protein
MGGCLLLLLLLLLPPPSPWLLLRLLPPEPPAGGEAQLCRGLLIQAAGAGCSCRGCCCALLPLPGCCCL